MGLKCFVVVQMYRVENYRATDTSLRCSAILIDEYGHSHYLAPT